MIKIGDFVTACFSGYWQLIDIKPLISNEDCDDGYVKRKKGEKICDLAILKKAFSTKMKPRIEFQYCNVQFIKPVPADVLEEINKYFYDNPQFKEKFDNAEVKLPRAVTNCYLNLPKEKEDDFRALIAKLPKGFTMDEFWKIAKKYKEYVSKPSCSFLLNFISYPWDVDKKGNTIYSCAELVEIK